MTEPHPVTVPAAVPAALPGGVSGGVSVVVLAYGDEPHLSDCIGSLLASVPVPQIVLVDNGAALAVAALPEHPALRIVRPERNLGFSGGCNLGAACADSDVIAFVNSDVRVAPDAISELAAALAQPGTGLVCAKVLLADDPDRVNSVGNPINYLCFSWSGSLGDPSASHVQPRAVAGISGATFAVRRQVWDHLGGFDDEFFAYCEDMDLSLRTWQQGLSVRFVPSAVSWHWHEFSRNPLKMYLLERNRMITLLTVYESRTFARLVPAIAAVELGVMAVAVRDGWGRQKWDSWVWLASHVDYLAQRRRRIQAARVADDSVLASVLQAKINPPPGFGMAVPGFVNAVLEWDWSHTRRGLSARVAQRARRRIGRTGRSSEKTTIGS